MWELQSCLQCALFIIAGENAMNDADVRYV